MSNHSTIAYRRDIDGLRALAVIIVVLFHASPRKFPFGFIGVDIFFVISGFLITTIILKELQKNEFTIKNFYVKRIKRIFPALITVLVVTLGLGIWILNSYELKELFFHTFSGTFFFSNFTLWSESGYFDTSSDFKPLLHLWSLSIEEQFYIFWPLILILIHKRKWSFVKITLAIIAASFALNLYLIKIDPSMTFYLLPTRAWELLLGALLGIVTLNGSLTFRNHHLISLLGALLIGSGFFLINKETVFPGYWAILPVLGSTLLIAAGDKGIVNKYLFSNRIMVAIGLVSYPLYLWHWPLLTYLRVIESGEAPGQWRNASLVISLLLSFLTYWFIEKKLRSAPASVKEKKTTRWLLSTLTIIGVISLFLSSSIRPSGDEAQTHQLFLAPKTRNFECEKLFSEYKGEFCLLSHNRSPEIAIIGDSHAHALYFGMSEAFQGESIVLLGHSACAPFKDTVSFGDRGKNRCKQEINQSLALLRNLPSLKKIFIHFRADTYAEEKALSRPFRLAFEDTLDYLGNDKEINFIHQVPELDFEPQQCLNLRPIKLTDVRADCTSNLEKVIGNQKKYRSLIKEIMNLKTIDPLSIFCSGNKCMGKISENILYRDRHHLNQYGAKYFWSNLKNIQ